MRSRLRARPGAPGTAPHHAEHVHGLRRLQRRPRARGLLMGAPTIPGLGILAGEEPKSADAGNAGANSGNSTPAKSADWGSAGAISGPRHMKGLENETVDSKPEILALPPPH